MKTKAAKRVLSAALTAVITASAVIGCAGQGDSEQEKGGSGSSALPTITMYPANASLTSGLVGGHKGEFFAENGFNLEVWAHSDERTNAILSSGDLPDIMYVPKENLNDMIEGGMLLNLDDYMDQLPNVTDNEKMDVALNYIRTYNSADTGSLYCLPLNVGDLITVYGFNDQTERNALKLLWEQFEDIGAPEIENFDDLLDVMEEMMAASPEDEAGNPFYGTVLNSGSDTDYFAGVTLYYRWQGYDTALLGYLLEEDMVNGTVSSILSTDSKYYEALKWLNEAYTRGLLDPDSINTDRQSMWNKTANHVMVPSGTLPGWADGGYYQYLVPGTKIYFNGTSTYGNGDYVIAISAETEHVEECLTLLNLFNDPDAIFRILNGPAGEGNIYTIEGDVISLTDEYLDWYENTDHSEAFTLASGEQESFWNTSFCVNTGELLSYKDSEGNYRTQRLEGFQELKDIAAENATYKTWQETTGHTDWMEWLESEGALVTESDLNNISTFAAIPDDTMKLTISAIKDTVVNASWQMVYAQSDEEFEQIWNSMVSDAEELGAEEVIEWKLADIDNAKQLRDALATE